MRLREKAERNSLKGRSNVGCLILVSVDAGSFDISPKSELHP